MPKAIVLSLGGSLIVPKEIDSAFLKEFLSVIRSYVKKGYRFAIICGGGGVARQYQNAASKIAGLDNEALDWIGIEATKLNAYLLMKLFGRDCEGKVVHDPSRKFTFKKPIAIASGWKPGRSTDYDAVLIAKNLKAHTVINMSNIEQVYSADPKKVKDAKPLSSLSWKDYRKISGNKWVAGMNLPFDPIAAKEAQSSKLKVYVIGKDLGNFKNVLNNKKWKGTVIC